ncbi:MAG TPA: M23 family metallopeptidase [Candidatus Dormibacteraeota bacterium]|jgi:murein DD-endopeptidase MepM/ murein hydrolase activator NlpD
MGWLRVGGICLAAALLWMVGASRVSSQEKLTMAAIVPGAVMTQPFGCSTLVLEPFDPYCPSHHIHTGVDLAARAGTPVHAASAGTASVGFDAQGAGLYVVVTSDNQVRVLYCHLAVALVVGTQPVTAGQVIGRIGSTGLATGPHLHFEVQVDGRAVDPVVWLAS